MAYWCAAQLECNRVALATHHLKLSGYRVYAPRLRTYRFSSGRKVEERPLLFPSYAFVWIGCSGTAPAGVAVSSA
jgi:hypothetical protein